MCCSAWDEEAAALMQPSMLSSHQSVSATPFQTEVSEVLRVEDGEVTRERQRIDQQADASTDTICLRRLRKVYGSGAQRKVCVVRSLLVELGTAHLPVTFIHSTAQHHLQTATYSRAQQTVCG